MVSDEVAYGRVSDLVKLGQGGAFSLSGICPGHLGIGEDSGAPVGEGSPGALGAGSLEAALGARLSAGSLLSTPFLPTSCPQGLRSTATYLRGSGGGGSARCLHGHLRPSLHQVPGAEAAGSPEGKEGRGVVLGGCLPLGNTGRHLPRHKGLGGS